MSWDAVGAISGLAALAGLLMTACFRRWEAVHLQSARHNAHFRGFIDDLLASSA